MPPTELLIKPINVNKMEVKPNILIKLGETYDHLEAQVVTFVPMFDYSHKGAQNQSIYILLPSKGPARGVKELGHVYYFLHV